MAAGLSIDCTERDNCSPSRFSRRESGVGIDRRANLDMGICSPPRHHRPRPAQHGRHEVLFPGPWSTGDGVDVLSSWVPAPGANQMPDVVLGHACGQHLLPRDHSMLGGEQRVDGPHGIQTFIIGEPMWRPSSSSAPGTTTIHPLGAVDGIDGIDAVDGIDGIDRVGGVEPAHPDPACMRSDPRQVET